MIASIQYSEVTGLTLIDWVVVTLYLAYILGQGWYYSKQQQSEGEFLVARAKPMGWFVVGLSMYATLLSAISYLGKPGEMINKGPMFTIAQLMALPIGYYLVAHVLMPRIMSQRVTSVYEYLEERIGPTGRMLAALLFILLRLVWMGLMTYLTSSVLALVMGLHADWVPALSVLVGGAAIAYSSMGGFRAVVVTDNIQAILLFVGAIAAIAVASYHLGDLSWVPTEWSPTWDTQPLFSLDPHVRVTLVGLLVHMVLWRVATSCSDQTSIQRFMAVKDARDARRSFIVNSMAVVVSSILLSLVGAALLGFFTRFPEALAPDMSIAKDADRLLPFFIAHYLPPGLSGLIVSAMLAAVMSSLDSGVNGVTAVVNRDLLARYNRLPATEAGRVRLLRIMTVVIGAVVILLGLLVKHVPGNIIDVTNKTASLVTTPIFGLFLMAWYMKKITPVAALLGTLSSITVAVLIGFWDMLTDQAGLSFTFIGPSALIASLGIGWLVSHWGPRRENERGALIWGVLGSSLILSIAALLVYRAH
jgi:SSS family solute:Na+ symporter